MTKYNLKKGKLLVSEPFLNDPNFHRSVVLLVEHDKNGSVGFILNQPTTYTLKELVKGLDESDFNFPVFIGGPVEQEYLHFLHPYGDLVTGSQHIIDDLYWGGDFEDIKFLIGNKNARWTEIKFFMGYSGWDKGQLLDEVKKKAWIVSDANEDIVYEADTLKLWNKVMAKLPIRYSIMANSPDDPNLN